MAAHHGTRMPIGAGQIAIGYVVVGVLWLFFSDTFLLDLLNGHRADATATAKGLGFVGCTGIFMYYVLSRRNMALFDTRTQQMQTSRHLAENQRVLSTLLGNLPGMAYRCLSDEHWTMEFVSDGCLALTGYGPSDLVDGDTYFADLIHPDDRDDVQKAVNGAVEKGTPFTVTYRIYSQTGRLRWVWEQGRKVDVMPDGTAVLEGFITDVTAVKEYEAENRRLTALAEYATEWIMITEMDGRVHYVNPAFESISGYDRSEIEGQTLEVLDPDSGEGSSLSEVVQSLDENGLWSGRVTAGKKDGSVCELDGTVVLVADGKAYDAYYVMIMRDVTQSILREQRIYQHQKLEAIGALAGGIAHDFNNILAAIIGYGELAKQESDAGERDSNLEQVLKAAGRARSLVQQILTFSRQGDIEKQPVRLRTVIDECFQLIRATLPTTVNIEAKIDKANGWTLADPSRIHQVLMNLCTNAAHAMQKSGGTLSVRLEEVQLGEDDVLVYPDLCPGQYVRLTVSDTGCGMDRETAERIFEPFFTTKKEGTGLGLSTVHGIIQEHGGTITVYSEPKKGTTFHIYLPSIEEETQDEVIEEEQTPVGEGQVVLFVDDDDALVTLGTQMLQRVGYEVVACNSSQQALETFRANPEHFDLIVTDLTMPRPSGTELISRIRKIDSAIPVILTTGFSESVTPHVAKRLGIAEVLFKPIPYKTLARSVHRAMTECGDADEGGADEEE